MHFLADENFNNKILEGLRNSIPDIDVVRVQDTEIYQASDWDVLDWAAKENRIRLTHDKQTMVGYVYARVKANSHMPGIIEVDANISIGQAIEELSLMIEVGNPMISRIRLDTSPSVSRMMRFFISH